MAKKKTTKKTKSLKDQRIDKIRKGLQYDFKYFGLDFDYEVNEPYFSCDCDDIHRCSTIEQVTVSDIDLDSISEKFVISKDKGSIFHYCIERILSHHKLYDPDSWDAGIDPGYYGEEVGEIKIYPNPQIDKDLLALCNKKNNIARIHYILNLEYGFILNSLKNITKVEIKSVPIKNIMLGVNSYHAKVNVDVNVTNRTLPFAICEYNGSHYTIVDGYHRITSALKENKRKVPIIIVR